MQIVMWGRSASAVIRNCREDDDIVVCPGGGTLYHRAYWQKDRTLSECTAARIRKKLG